MNKRVVLVIVEAEDGGFGVQLVADAAPGPSPDEMHERFANLARVPNSLRGRATLVELAYDGSTEAKCVDVKCKALPDEEILGARPKMTKGHRLGSGDPMEPLES